MVRAPLPKSDPSRDAGALLRRLGFAVLTVGVPSAALVARRGTVLLVPIGISLIVIAAMLDGQNRPLRGVLRSLSASPGSVAAALALAWSVVSLLWTPAGGQAYERCLSTVGTCGIAMLGYAALPDRMRSANLYLVPVGVALAAFLAVLLATVWEASRFDIEDDGQSLGRGLTVVALFVWPAIAWLRSRERDLEALTLAVAVATAALVIGARTPVPIALAAGALIYALASTAPQGAATTLAFAMSGLVALAPGLLLIRSAPGGLAPWVEALAPWRSIALSDPVHLLTGHGFGAFLLGRSRGLVPPASSSALVQLWYDLGLVGALAVAAALWAGPRAAAIGYAALFPGVVAAYATAFTLAVCGVGTGQMWFLTSLSVLALSFVATERGQFRTVRPRAVLFGPTRGTA